MKPAHEPESGEVMRDGPPGIVIRRGQEPVLRPAIRAFVWGGEVPVMPTLPFGRWKPSAA